MGFTVKYKSHKCLQVEINQIEYPKNFYQETVLSKTFALPDLMVENFHM